MYDIKCFYRIVLSAQSFIILQKKCTMEEEKKIEEQNPTWSGRSYLEEESGWGETPFYPILFPPLNKPSYLPPPPHSNPFTTPIRGTLGANI
jgi:hypothetical protein